MSSKQELTHEDKVSILTKLRNEVSFGLVTVRPDSEGVILYKSGASRVGGEPAIEIPHQNPYLTEHPPTSLSELLSKYGCVEEEVDGFTYITVNEDALSKRP